MRQFYINITSLTTPMVDLGNAKHGTSCIIGEIHYLLVVFFYIFLNYWHFKSYIQEQDIPLFVELIIFSVILHRRMRSLGLLLKLLAGNLNELMRVHDWTTQLKILCCFYQKFGAASTFGSTVQQKSQILDKDFMIL